MLKIIGKENCTKCNELKTRLENLKIEFQEIDLDKIEPTKKSSIIRMARKERIIGLPIIMNDDSIMKEDEINKLISD